MFLRGLAPIRCGKNMAYGEGGYMNAENSEKVSLKQKAAHELVQFAAIFLYLAFFFCALATYSMLLLNEFNVSYFTYGFALINALVIAKVILIGEYAHLGKRHEAKPLLQAAVYKAFLFTLLAFAFHVVEEVIKLIVYRENMSRGLHEMRIDDLLGRTLVVFCTFIPLFAFRELQRVLGEKNFRDLFFRTGATAKSELPSGDPTIVSWTSDSISELASLEQSAQTEGHARHP
jgi:hypothetical protein